MHVFLLKGEKRRAALWQTCCNCCNGIWMQL